jgi:hypothetical protein
LSKQRFQGGHLRGAIVGSHVNPGNGGYYPDNAAVKAVSESLSGSGANQPVRGRSGCGCGDVQAVRQVPHRHRISLDAIERSELLSA